MNKKEQINFIEDTLEELRFSGITIQHFLKSIKMSRTHWHFIKKGKRKLTDEKQKQILDFTVDRCI